MKILLSHPTGNENVRAALEGFLEAGLLSEFNTSIALFEGDFLDKISAQGPLKEFRRRRFHHSLKRATKSYPFLEAGRLLADKIRMKGLTRHEKGMFSIDAVYNYIDKRSAGRLTKLNRKKVNAVYAYEDGAEMSFIAAKRLGIQCIYDLPIGYWRSARSLLDKERDKWPDWAATLSGFRDSQAKLEQKDNELRLADHIFVASHFTKMTLDDFPGKLSKIEVVPYGFPAVTSEKTYSAINGRKLKLLFIGGLSQRKGIADLFAAVEKFSNHVELTVVGKGFTNECTALTSALNKHKWIPALSHADILSIMRQHDVFVFPSLFEGFGLVITEAMSQGTPVITTERTAGPEFINDSHNGWLIEAGSVSALESAIENILFNPGSIRAAGKAAMETARKRPWQVYGEELARAVLSIESNVSI